jgi:hypothetical protein
MGRFFIHKRPCNRARPKAGRWKSRANCEKKDGTSTWAVEQKMPCTRYKTSLSTSSTSLLRLRRILYSHSPLSLPSLPFVRHPVASMGKQTEEREDESKPCCRPLMGSGISEQILQMRKLSPGGEGALVDHAIDFIAAGPLGVAGLLRRKEDGRAVYILSEQPNIGQTVTIPAAAPGEMPDHSHRWGCVLIGDRCEIR